MTTFIKELWLLWVQSVCWLHVQTTPSHPTLAKALPREQSPDG